MNSHESTRSRLTFALHCICIICEKSASYRTCHYLKRTRPPQRNWTCVLYLRNILMFAICFPINAVRDFVYIIVQKLLHVMYIVSPSAFPGKYIYCGNMRIHKKSYLFHGINYRIYTHRRQTVPKYLLMFHECKSSSKSVAYRSVRTLWRFRVIYSS